MTYTKLETYLTSKKCCLFGTWNREHPPPPTVEHGCVGVELLGCYSASGARSLLRVWIRSEKNVLENIVKKETKNQAVVKIKFGLCLLGFVIYFSRVRHHLLLPSCRLLIFVLLFLFFIFCFASPPAPHPSPLPLFLCVLPRLLHLQQYNPWKLVKTSSEGQNKLLLQILSQSH